MPDKPTWEPRPGADALQGTISRNSINGSKDTLGVIFPTKPDGVEFLRENNAWGFVRIKKQPEFVIMYVSGSAKEVRYFARVLDIVDAKEANLARSEDEYPQFDTHKKVVVFEPGTLYEIENPIPYRVKTPYSMRYTTLGQFRSATGTDELF